MSSTWRAEQEIQAGLRRAGAISDRQRQAQEVALKREQDRIQREKDAEDKAPRDAEAIALAEEERLSEENAAREKARRGAEAAAAILKAKLQPSKPAEPTYPTPWGKWQWDGTWRDNNEFRFRQIADIMDITQLGMLCYLFMISILRLQTHFFSRVA
jgi:hypothetical protein